MKHLKTLEGIMRDVTFVLVLGLLAAISALPSPDPIILKTDNDMRYSYLEDDAGSAQLVDNWFKLSDLVKMARYNPDQTNEYHLFTRSNPVISQPLVLNNIQILQSSNYNPRLRTKVLMHGFIGSATSPMNQQLVPAYLAAENCNVIVLDWSDGSYWGPRAVQAGHAAGRFINWMNSVSGSTPNMYTIVGYSVGAHGAALMARTVNGNVGYVIGLDPAERWNSVQVFSPSDGLYTEVIHTSIMGKQNTLGQVDFYPNEGLNMPGCWTDLCSHMRSYTYLAESVVRSGFTGNRCQSVAEAHAGNCNAAGTLRMGGLEPKTGNFGIFHLRTNSNQPFSRD